MRKRILKVRWCDTTRSKYLTNDGQNGTCAKQNSQNNGVFMSLQGGQ